MNAEYLQVGDLHVHVGFEPILRQHRLCDLDALLTTPGQGSLHKKGLAGWRERVALELQSPQGLQRFYLKRYCRPPLMQQVMRLLRGGSSTGGLEADWLQRMSREGIQVPVIAAVGERKKGALEQHSVLLTAAVPGQSLEQWIPHALQENALHRALKHNLGRALAGLVARLHSAGMVHCDLYLSHVFVDRPDQGPVQLYLIDLQRVIAPRWRMRRWRVKDLAALNYSTPRAVASRSDRLRWLKWYLGVAKLASGDKALVHRIVAKTALIARHSRKHGLG